MKSIVATSGEFATKPSPEQGGHVRGLRHREWIVVHTTNHADEGSSITNVAVKIKGAVPQHPLGAFKAGFLTGILMAPEYKLRNRRQPKSQGKAHA